MKFFGKKRLVVSVESIFIDEVWEEIQKIVHRGKIRKWFIVTTANYNYLQSLYNLSISKLDLANLMAKRYNWMLQNGQELELRIFTTRLANNIDKQEQEIILKEALHFMAKGLKIKPTEVMFGWYAVNKDGKDLLQQYNLKLADEKSYPKVMADYEIVESIWKKKNKKRK